MPHTRSAKKSLRKSAKRRLHNRAAKKAIKLQVKKLLEVAEGDDINLLRQEFLVASKKLDKAASRRIVHPNMAARKKSQLARLLRQKETAKAAPTT
jgi:small subunit ribosomal protein S20